MKQECNTVQYEQGDESALVMFMLRCTNVPIGTVVSLQSDNPRTQPPIVIPPTIVNSYPSFVVGITCEVPAGYNAKLTYCYILPEGVKPPPGFNIELVAAVVAGTNMKVLK